MERRLCEQGKDLYVFCRQKAMELLGVELGRRQTIQGASRSAWLEISRGVEVARLAYEEARDRYTNHAKLCDVCLGDVPQFYLLSAPKHAAAEQSGFMQT
jgi:hypothetical protein